MPTRSKINASSETKTPKRPIRVGRSARHRCAIASFSVCFGAFLLFSFGVQAATEYELDCAKVAESKAPDSQRLQELFKLDWEHTMRESPEFATLVGYPGQNDR